MARLVLHQLWLCAAIAVVLLGKVVRAADEADDDNKFLYPPKNSTFHYLDTINVAFKTDYDEPWLYLYCWDSNDARQGNSSVFIANQWYERLTASIRDSLL